MVKTSSTSNEPPTSTGPAKPEPLLHNTTEAPSEQAISSNNINSSVPPTNTANINNNLNNNRKSLPSKYYPSTSKGRAVETTDGILIIKV